MVSVILSIRSTHSTRILCFNRAKGEISHQYFSLQLHKYRRVNRSGSYAGLITQNDVGSNPTPATRIIYLFAPLNRIMLKQRNIYVADSIVLVSRKVDLQCLKAIGYVTGTTVIPRPRRYIYILKC